MDSGNEMYANDYKELQEMLSHYPGISIIAVEKDPPEQYVIEYKLFGYGYDANGDVQMARRHRIQVNLPFGYPHFPPTVKPLTRICHPDVAEHAVRIAEYWQNNPSLADLIIHIGHMIRGEVYSIEGAFNQQAAEWYQLNKHKLPLAELEYDDPNRTQPEAKRVGIPFKFIGGILVLGLVATGGGLFYRDTLILKESEKKLHQVQKGIGSRQFQEARAIGKDAINSLKGILLLGSARDKRQAELVGMLGSEAMREGLDGRVEYRGQYIPIRVADTLQETERQKNAAVMQIAAGDLDGATGSFAAAIRLAEENGLTEAADDVRHVSATKRLEYHVERANSRYSDQKWQEAGDEYGVALSILQNESAYLSSDAIATRGKLEKLNILAKVNVHKGEAIAAEKAGQFDKAVDHYRGIASLIRHNPYGEDPMLMQIAVDAERQGGRVAEQSLIVAGTTYLLENYREIFTQHYPGLHGPALQSPQVRFLERNDGKLVFIMSCIELIQRNSNEFRLFYQYDPVGRTWSMYREQK